MSFRCTVCGELHDELPHLGIEQPDPWWNVAPEEREQRIELTTDTCIIDNEHFFIRGVLQLPIHDHPEPFGFGVWVSQKRENFHAYLKVPQSRKIGPFFGWLSTRIDYYAEDTFLLKTMAHFRGAGLRPVIEVEPSEHPLAVDQCEGISLAKAWEIVHHYTDRE